MGDLFRGERLQIMLTAEEIAALDDWRFQHKLPSRAAAIRELLRRGLDSPAGVHAKRSKDFSVTAGIPSRQLMEE